MTSGTRCANSAAIDRLGGKEEASNPKRVPLDDWPTRIGEVTDLLLKRSRIALNEAYDVVCEGRIVGRIMLTNVLAVYSLFDQPIGRDLQRQRNGQSE